MHRFLDIISPPNVQKICDCSPAEPAGPVLDDVFFQSTLVTNDGGYVSVHSLFAHKTVAIDVSVNPVFGTTL